MIYHRMEWGSHRGWSNQHSLLWGEEVLSHHAPYLPYVWYIYIHTSRVYLKSGYVLGQLFRYTRPHNRIWDDQGFAQFVSRDLLLSLHLQKLGTASISEKSRLLLSIQQHVPFKRIPSARIFGTFNGIGTDFSGFNHESNQAAPRRPRRWGRWGWWRAHARAADGAWADGWFFLVGLWRRVSHIEKCRFPKLGEPPLNHPCIDGIFHELNHLVKWVPPWLWEPPNEQEHQEMDTIVVSQYCQTLRSVCWTGLVSATRTWLDSQEDWQQICALFGTYSSSFGGFLK